MKFFFSLIIAFSLLAPGAFAESKTKQQHIVIKLDSGTNDLHAAFMAIKLGKMLLKEKNKVTLFANLEAVRLFHRHQPLNLVWGSGKKTYAEHHKEFLSLGGKILVCPHCAKAVGMPKKDLKKGTTIADEAMISKLFTEADKVISY
jgi:predicted peroxiredoxin